MCGQMCGSWTYTSTGIYQSWVKEQLTCRDGHFVGKSLRSGVIADPAPGAGIAPRLTITALDHEFGSCAVWAHRAHHVCHAAHVRAFFSGHEVFRPATAHGTCARGAREPREAVPAPRGAVAHQDSRRAHCAR